jgi:hypothetical protein
MPSLVALQGGEGCPLVARHVRWWPETKLEKKNPPMNYGKEDVGSTAEELSGGHLTEGEQDI